MDQFIKAVTHNYFYLGQSRPIIPNILHITYVQNRGAAFGLFQGYRIPLIVISLLVAAVVIYFFAVNSRRDKVLDLSLGLILGGTVSNLLDRIFRAYVIDYIDFRFWPVFNISDAAINIGVLIIIFRIIFGKEKHTS